MSEKKINEIIQTALFFIIVIFGAIVPVIDSWHKWLVAIFLLFIPLYFYKRKFPLFGHSLFFLMAYIIRCLPFYKLGLMLIIPLVLYVVILFFSKSIRKDNGWLVRGDVNLRLILYGIAVVVISSVALAVWYLLTSPDLEIYSEFFPQIEFWKLISLGVLFSVTNALVEEAVYRGILWDGLGKLISDIKIVIILQAIVFAVAHLWGIPNGIIGMFLAFIYGIFLGTIRYLSRGLLMPILTHIAADMTIFFILMDIFGRI